MILFLLACAGRSPAGSEDTVDAEPSHWTLLDEADGGPIVGLSGDGPDFVVAVSEDLENRVWVWDGTTLMEEEPWFWCGASSVVVVPDADVYAVGPEGCAWNWPGADSWISQSSFVEVGLRSVYGTRHGSLWAAGGDNGVPSLIHYDGTMYTEELLDPTLTDGTAGALNAVRGGGAAWVAVGDKGLALTLAAKEWSRSTTATTATLRALCGRDDGVMIAVGGDDQGVLLAWDGTNWGAPVLLDAPALYGCWTDAAGITYVVGDYAYAGTWDGTVLTADIVDTSDDLRAVWGDDAGTVYAAGGYAGEPPTSVFLARDEVGG